MKGHPGALILPNVLAFPVAMFGVVLAGAVQVNVNPLYSAAELAHQLQDAEVDTVIVSAGATQTLADAMKSASVRRILVVAPDDLGQAAMPCPPMRRAPGTCWWPIRRAGP
jgi:long-chain acyl-CoA synthetase